MDTKPKKDHGRILVGAVAFAGMIFVFVNSFGQDQLPVAQAYRGMTCGILFLYSILHD